MPKINISVSFKNVEEPEEFENMDSFEIVKGGKFLSQTTDIDMEYYIPLENVLYFEINYKGGGHVRWLI